MLREMETNYRSHTNTHTVKEDLRCLGGTCNLQRTLL